MDSQKLFSRVKKLQLLSAKLMENLLAGNYRSVFRGPGLEFDEVREYVEGDDARLIDWNVSSRMASPYTKTFREEREMVLFIIMDVSPSLYYGSGDTNKIEVIQTLYALLAFAAVQNNDRVGGAFFTDRIERWVPPMKGKKQALRLVQDMLAIEPEGTGSDLALSMRTVQEFSKQRGICVILSDFKSTGYWRELSQLSKKHDVIAIRVLDENDESFPKTGLLQLQDPETGETVLSYGKGKKFNAQYRKYWEAQKLRWTQECHKRGVDTLSIYTSEDPAERLIRFFKRRKKG
ncbi:MAG: DUF58 domain-containing protein [Spirochaetia bacterium]